jgi:hypothetical protein
MIATRLASAWRWDVPGSAKSPTAGLKTAPDIKSAYAAMLQRYQAALPAHHIDVPSLANSNSAP